MIDLWPYSVQSPALWHSTQSKIYLPTDTGLMIDLCPVNFLCPVIWHSKQSKISPPVCRVQFSSTQSNPKSTFRLTQSSSLALKTIQELQTDTGLMVSLWQVSLKSPALWHSKQSNIYLPSDTGLMIDLCPINFQSPAIWHSKQLKGLINDMYPVSLLSHRIDD